MEKKYPDKTEYGKNGVPIGVTRYIGDIPTYTPLPPRVPGRPEIDLETDHCTGEEVAIRLDEAIIEFRRATSRGGTAQAEREALQKIRKIREWVLLASERISIDNPQGCTIQHGANERRARRAAELADKELREMGIDPDAPDSMFGPLDA